MRLTQRKSRTWRIRKRGDDKIMKNEPLTIEELKEMAGQPVWCPDEEAYGVIMCDSIGKWAGIPFMHGVWYHDGIGAEFNHNIIERKENCTKLIRYISVQISVTQCFLLM